MSRLLPFKTPVIIQKYTQWLESSEDIVTVGDILYLDDESFAELLARSPTALLSSALRRLRTVATQSATNAWFSSAQRAAKEEGLFGGISSGATLAAIGKKINELEEGSRVLGFNYDTGERYLSVADLF